MSDMGVRRLTLLSTTSDLLGGLEVRQCPISKGPCPGECIFAEVMESQRLGVVVFDLAHRSLFFVNRSARELLERLGQASDYASLSELLLPPEGSPEALAPVFAAEPRRLGSRLLGYTVYRARSFAWVYVRDITEKVRMESIAEAVETMNNIGYVFAAVRHELGNPINSIKAALSVLRANLDSYPLHTVADYIERLISEVGRVENLLRSLRSFSLYERPELQRVKVGAFVSSFAGLVADEARKRGFALTVAAEDECCALCDPRALQQVLLNLFANAADALRERDEPELRIGVSAGDGLVSIRVSDNGSGMTEEQTRNLFKPFYTSKENGTGLGLVISRKMLAKMGGTIAVDSNVGEGTTVTITLPQCEPAP